MFKWFGCDKSIEKRIDEATIDIYKMRGKFVQVLNYKLVVVLETCISCILSFDRNSAIVQVAKKAIEENNEAIRILNSRD